MTKERIQSGNAWRGCARVGTRGGTRARQSLLKEVDENAGNIMASPRSPRSNSSVITFATEAASRSQQTFPWPHINETQLISVEGPSFLVLLSSTDNFLVGSCPRPHPFVALLYCFGVTSRSFCEADHQTWCRIRDFVWWVCRPVAILVYVS